MDCNVSQNQVLVSCSSVEEAKNLEIALKDIAFDGLDDVLREYKELKAQVKLTNNELLELDKQNADLLVKIDKLEAKLTNKKSKK